MKETLRPAEARFPRVLCAANGHSDEGRHRVFGRYNSALAFISFVSVQGSFLLHGRGPLPRFTGNVRHGAGACLPSNR